MKKSAVFLDRDGVINRNDRGPVNSPSELVLYPKAAEAIRALKQAGFPLFVVTNQGGVGLGYLSKEELEEIHRYLIAEVESAGGAIDDIVACIHDPSAGCDCRKPKPGMIFALAEKYGLDLKTSYMVGDRDTDIQAGRAAGTKTVFVGATDRAPKEADYVAPDLWTAAQWILDQRATKS
ncbi:MAG: HAD family hydrolase [Firmicutes bacterium]|nr:HAD family hydrolase [Bacillota bacterium]